MTEVKALIDKNTFEEVYTLPINKKALTCRWVFKVKDATKHEPEIYRAQGWLYTVSNKGKVLILVRHLLL